MKHFLIAFILFVPSLLLGQEKQLRKISRLYEKKNDEKVIRLAKVYKQDYPARGEFYLVESKSRYRLYSTGRIKSEKQLSTVLENYKRAQELMSAVNNVSSDT